jgi:glycosyltransferase involved in cell wall biosynthesis
MLYGEFVAKMLIRSSVYEKILLKFDIIHLNDRAAAYTKAAADFKNRKLLTIHWRPSKIDEDTFSKLDAIVAPSKHLSKAVNEALGLPSEVIYNGVDVSWFNTKITKINARRVLGLPKTPRKVIFWNGRLDPIKDPKTLIDAIPIVVKEIPDSLFVIKGRTGQQDILRYAKKYIKSTGIEQNVMMLNRWDFPTKMPYYYRSADVCVHTSLFEGCSLVLIEAMACGVPIVVTDIPAVYEPVGNAGLHFEPKNSEDLAEKIVRILYDEKLRIKLRDKGLKRILELGLTWEKASEHYRDLYLSLM